MFISVQRGVQSLLNTMFKQLSATGMAYLRPDYNNTLFASIITSKNVNIAVSFEVLSYLRNKKGELSGLDILQVDASFIKEGVNILVYEDEKVEILDNNTRNEVGVLALKCDELSIAKD